MIGRLPHRRDALAFAGCAMLAGKALAQPRPPAIGFLNSQSAEGWERLTAAFRQGLQEGGFTVGRDVVLEHHWAEGRNERLGGLAAELVARKVALIVATGGPDPVRAAKAATADIPIIFTTGADPVRLGLVETLARPGGNVTGFTLFTRQLGPKRLELLREAALTARTVAMLVNPDNSGSAEQIVELRPAAETFGLRLEIIEASSATAFPAAVALAVSRGAGALFVASDAYFFARRAELTAAVAERRVPAIYEARPFAEVGGLLAYGVDFAEINRRLGLYAARILKGERPALLPVEQPTRFEFAVNLKTARAHGLDLPATLLAQADEVIE